MSCHPRAQSGRVRLGLLFLITLALLVLVFELGLRLVQPKGYTAAELKPSFLTLQEKARSIGHPYMGYALKPSWNREADALDPKQGQKSHNAAGFRGPWRPREKSEGTYRIVCLGGSSTYGSSPSSDATTWPARLEARLNEAQERSVEVLNFGVFGYSTFESNVNLSFRAIDYSPDLVIVYHTINDARFALWNAGGEVQPDNTHLRALWPLYTPSPGEELLEHSYAYLVWRKKFTQHLARFQFIDALAMVGYDGSKDQFADGEFSKVGVHSFQRNLVNIQAVAKAHSAQVLLVTQGCDRDDIQAKSRANQLQLFDYFGTILQVVAEERGLLFLDARTPLEAAWAPIQAEVKALEAEAAGLKTAGDPGWSAKAREAYERGIFTGDVHLTDRGADLLARLMAEKLLAEGVLR